MSETTRCLKADHEGWCCILRAGHDGDCKPYSEPRGRGAPEAAEGLDLSSDALREYAEVCDVVATGLREMSESPQNDGEPRMVLEDLADDCTTFGKAFRALSAERAALLARVAQLTAERDALREHLNATGDDAMRDLLRQYLAENDHLAEVARAQTERADRAEQDAARYRFLRSRLTDGGTMYDPANHRRHVSLRLPVNIGAYFPSGTDAISADAIIDAARTPSPTTTEPTDNAS